MERTTKLNFFSKHLDIVIVFSVIILCGLLGLSGFTEKLEFRLYDDLLSIKPATTQNPNVRLVNIDDAASGEMGVWPWGREILADVLVRLREVGAKTAQEMGKVMGVATKKLAGKADGKDISAKVKALLS